MAITIYTYSNPYEIHKEPYWASIQNCFHLCVSQTLVNGLCDQYKEFYKGKLTTVTMNEQGVALVSGVTPRIFSMIAGGHLSPYTVMLEVLESERYAKIVA